MKFSELSLTIVYVNLSHREDRRAETEYQLSLLGLQAERQPGIHASWVRDCWGFQNERRYACSLAKRLAIRRGFQTGADAVLLLEDDVVFHPEFHCQLEQIELPPDWGMLYLGCRHLSKPEVVSPGLVRCSRATDNHAVLVHRRYYRAVLRGLAGRCRGAERTIRYSDTQLAGCQHLIPSYAAYPNLVWQGYSFSNTSQHSLTHYHKDGRQVSHSAMMDEVDAEMGRMVRGEPAAIRQPFAVPLSASAESPEQLAIPAVECVIVAWRAHNLERIVEAFRAQTVPCRVTIITSGRMAQGLPVPEDVLGKADRVFRTSQEYGAFNRYLPAFVYECEFVYLHDDDMLPGRRLVEHFLRQARALGGFGVLGQLGRRIVNGGYHAANVRRTGRPEQVDVIVRGYFLPTANLPFVLESLHLLGLKPGRDDLEDDLVLAWSMARKGLKCWLTPQDQDAETRMVKEELSPAEARSLRGEHYAIRDAFVRRFWRKEWLTKEHLATSQ